MSKSNRFFPEVRETRVDSYYSVLSCAQSQLSHQLTIIIHPMQMSLRGQLPRPFQDRLYGQLGSYEPQLTILKRKLRSESCKGLNPRRINTVDGLGQ